MRKTLILLAILTCFIVLPSFSEGMSFSGYLDAYLTKFTDIADAQDMYKEASLAYEGAVARNASAIELEILLSAKERKAIDIKDVTNQAAIDAFILYAQYREYGRAFSLAEARLSEAEETMRNDESQFSLGLISETEYLSRKLNLLNAASNFTIAKRNLEDSERRIARMTGANATFANVPAFDADSILKSLSGVSVDIAMALDAEVYSAKANLSINEKIWKVISVSSYANDLEKKDASDKFKAAKKAYRIALETVEDYCIKLDRSIADLRRQFEKYSVSNRITEILSESALLKKTYGKATELELAKVRSEQQARVNELEQLTYKIVQKKLESLKVTKNDCVAYLKEILK